MLRERGREHGESDRRERREESAPAGNPLAAAVEQEGARREATHRRTASTDDARCERFDGDGEKEQSMNICAIAAGARAGVQWLPEDREVEC
tara:strand:+ start:980 stop:1255 length:276 start_codon:yes stop_codon:yes gene_type:complete